MLVTRYLFKNLFHVTVFVALTLILVVWLTQSMKLLELVANSDAPLGLFLELVLLTLPKFLEIILPLSVAVAVFFTYNKLIMDNELIVLRACGVDQYALARSAIILAVGTSLLVMLLSTWISPKCAGQVQVLRQTVKTQYSAFLLREGIFNTFGDQITVYLRAREENGDMLGLVIHDTRNRTKPSVTIIAKRGRVVMDGDTPTIVVFDGLHQQMDADRKSLSRLYFSRYTIEINSLEGATPERWRNAGERTLGELLNPDVTNKKDRENSNLFLVEAGNRIATPWNALSFTMIALVSILLGPFNRRGQGGRILVGTVLVMAVQAMNMGFAFLSKKHPGAVILVYINTFLPILCGFYFLHLSGEQRLMSVMRRWNGLFNRSERRAA